MPENPFADVVYASVDTDADPNTLKAAMLVLWAEARNTGDGWAALELSTESCMVPVSTWAKHLRNQLQPVPERHRCQNCNMSGYRQDTASAAWCRNTACSNDGIPCVEHQCYWATP